MLSALYYLFLVLLCTFFMLLSAVALVVCWPFDRARRVVHFLSRVLVRIFFAVPPFWRQRVEGLGRIDRRRPYVIVVNHNTGRAAEAMEQLLREGRMWIARGASVAVFPEGTRSKDGEIHRFKAGAFTLAKEAGADILPVVLDGTKSLIGPKGLFDWRNRITIRVLPPVPAGEVASADTHELMRRVHDDMCAALADIRNNR